MPTFVQSPAQRRTDTGSGQFTGRHWIAILMLIAFAFRAGWALSRPSDASAIARLPDQTEYLELGRSLLAGQGLKLFDPRFGQWVYAYRMPGYPLFVAALGARPLLIRLAQAAIDTSVVLAVYLLARELFGPRHRSGVVSADANRPALLAALLVAINPFLIFFSALILSETLSVAMLIWGMVLLVRGRPFRLAWIAGLLVLVLSIHVRPSAGPLPWLLGAASLLVNRPSRPSYGLFGALSAMTLLVALLLVIALFPWAWRNSRVDVLGRWVWTTTNSGITAYDGWNPASHGDSNQAFVRTMPELRQMNEVQRSDYLQKLANQYVRAHPAHAMRLALLKLLRTWSPAPLGKQYGSGRLVMLSLLYCLPLDLLIAAGLIRSGVPAAVKVLLVTPAIYLSAIHMASVGSLRYRLPAEPPMAVIAASVWVQRKSDPIG